MKYKFIIVGAGLTGCVIAQSLAARHKKPVLIVENRNHIGGNCYDYRNKNNVLVHRYGPHIFHTNRQNVWNYLSKFTTWEQYEHKVLAKVDGNLVNIPFNLNSLYKCFPKSLAGKLARKLIANYKYGSKIPILTLKNSNDEDLQSLAGYIYEKIFAGYTKKQWDMELSELDSSVAARVPIFVSKDDRYFTDKYQGLPSSGYSKLFNNIVDNKNINILLSTNFFDIKSQLNFEKLIFTGKIDAYFEYKFGELKYRDLRFEFSDYDFDEFQPVSQVNYPCGEDFTRITEFKHFYKTKNIGTTIAKEFSEPHNSAESVAPFYPIPTKNSAEIYEKYSLEASKLKEVLFCGRLGSYKYYNMDEAVAYALKISENI